MFSLFKKKKDITSNHSPQKNVPHFTCDKFSYSWNYVSGEKEFVNFNYDILVTNPFNHTLKEYLLFDLVITEKHFNFFGGEKRWGRGTTYDKWCAGEIKKFKSCISIPKEDFKNTPKQLSFVLYIVYYSGNRVIGREIITSIPILIGDWHQIQRRIHDEAF
jgi:hypothetical protein